MKYRSIQLFTAIVLVFSFVGQASAQLEFLKMIFEPRILRLTEELRTYIRIELPPVSHKREEELHHVDLIFLKAMELSKRQISTALLATSIVVLNRTDIKPTLPILGTVTVPLPTEDSTDAVARINKLPRYIYPDSPQDRWGDSDKLVHFFGSAYLTYESGATPIPEALGKFVETGEVALKLDTATDPRDLFTNRLGQQFGRALSEGRDVIPSDYLSAKYIRK